MPKKNSIVFEYEMTTTTTKEFTYTALRKTLGEVRDLLLSHGINGGDKKLDMEVICDERSCGMAACIGGWTSLFMLGFAGSNSAQEQDTASELFEVLIELDNNVKGDGLLSSLFYHFAATRAFNEPNVAATAIDRYLKGKQPWPDGDMPDVLPYTKRAKKAK